MAEKKTRIPLLVLDAFVGLTAVYGAIFVVPSLPTAWLNFFPDYSVPAIALGAVGVVALVALVMVLVAPAIGGEMSLVAGLMMMAFELVEALAVGSLLSPPPVSNPEGQVALWLQVVYLVLGAAMAVLGRALWQRGTGSHRWTRTWA